MIKNNILFFLVTFFVLSCFWQCTKQDDFLTKAEAKLQISTDTLRCDTVFSQLGSATYQFRLINTHSQPIKISRIYIPETTKKSFFNLNIDGIAGNDQGNIEIPAKDSIYVFVRVTIDPNQPLSVSPFVINEEILLETNGNLQRVVLEAWGQNANYLPNRFSAGTLSLLTCDLNNLTWDDPKPYVIYGALLIDSCTLIIPPGARIYIHGGLARNSNRELYRDGIIYMLPQGKIKVAGTADKPVVIQGDRLEPDFKDVAGQWAGIIIGPGSTDNVIQFAEIKNSTVGVRVDSAASLTIRQTKIYNTSGAAIQGQQATIRAENCLFYNNASNSVALNYGGDYDFKYCTVASYGAAAASLYFSNTLCLAQFCTEFRTAQLYANFKNCIFFGSRKDQIEPFNRIPLLAPNDLNYRFENCLFRVEELLTKGDFTNFLNYCNPQCINGSGTSKVFKDPNKDDYSLDSLSVGIEKAAPIVGITTDLLGKPRDATKPDVGCLER